MTSTQPEDAKMPLTQHLEELRWRLIWSLVAIGVCFAACYNFSDSLFMFLTRPLLRQSALGVQLIGTGVTEAFFTKLKVSLIAGLFIASPMIFYQLWKFVAPGLYEQEKRHALPFVFFASLFFVLGAAFCYVVVLPVGYAFFVEQYQTIGVQPSIRISEYLTFTARMLLAFGATFELPVITFFLARVGMVDHLSLIRPWRYAIIAIFVVAAVLTPGPDIASQMLMAAPLLVLYGVSIGVAYAFAQPRSTAVATPAGDA